MAKVKSKKPRVDVLKNNNPGGKPFVRKTTYKRKKT